MGQNSRHQMDHRMFRLSFVSTINVFGPSFDPIPWWQGLQFTFYQYWAPLIIHFSRIVPYKQFINHPATGYPIYGKPTIFPYFQCSILFLQDFSLDSSSFPRRFFSAAYRSKRSNNSVAQSLGAPPSAAGSVVDIFLRSVEIDTGIGAGGGDEHSNFQFCLQDWQQT